MNFSFANAALLPLLALLALPLLIHLIARVQPRRYAFSSLSFILHSTRKSRRWQRPKDWLILLLRTLLVAALLLLFLQPVTYTAETWTEGADEGRTVVLVIDATASMAHNEGAGSRFSRAMAEASGVIGSLREGDLAAIVWVRDRPEAVSRPSRNLDFLRETLQRARVTEETGQGHAAVELGLDILAGAEGVREMVVVSDFQENSWREGLPDIPASVRLALLPVSSQPRPANTALRRLWLEPAQPLAGESAVLTAEVANYSDQPRRLEVLFSSEGLRHTETVMLNAWETRLASTVLSWDGPGEYLVQAEIPEDAFPLDNSRARVVRVSPGTRVLPSGDSTLPQIPWERVFRAHNGVAMDAAVRDPQSFGEEADLIIWSGDDPRGQPRFDAVFARGGTVLWHPAEGARIGDGTARLQRLREPQVLRMERPDDGLFQIFSGGDYGNPARGRYEERLRWPGSVGDLTTLMSWEDDSPALARQNIGPGQLYLWNLPLEQEGQLAFALQPEYVALAGELLREARSRRQARDGGITLAGRSVLRSFPTSWGVRHPEITGPEDFKQSPTWKQGEGTDDFITESLPHVGVYRWINEGERVGLTAVVFPTDQSDLRTLPLNALQAASEGIVLRGSSQIRQLREGKEWWPLFLGIAVALTMTELLLCRYARNPGQGGLT